MNVWCYFTVSIIAGVVTAKDECVNSCNLAVCVQVTGKDIDSVVDIPTSLAKLCYRNTQTCGCNFGALFYRDSVGLVAPACTMYPRAAADLPNKLRCIEHARKEQKEKAQFLGLYPNNELHVCLNQLNTDSGFLKVTNPRKCGYTVAIVVGDKVTDTTSVAREVRELKNKGVSINCIVVGGRAPLIASDYYQLCDKTQLYTDMASVNPDLNCCRQSSTVSPTTSAPIGTTTTTPSTDNRGLLRFDLQSTGKVPTVPPLVPEVKVASHIQCATKCHGLKSCRRFTISDVTGMCRLYGSVDAARDEAGVHFYGIA